MDVAGTRSRARVAGSAFGQTSLYRGRRWVCPSRKQWNEDRLPLAISDLEATSTGDETRFSSTRPLRRRALSAARGSPLSAIWAHVRRSLPQDRQRAYRRACRAENLAHQIHATDQLRRRDSPAICHNGIAKGIRERAPPRGGASFLFERDLRPTKTPCATNATSMVERTTAWRKSRTGRSGRTDRPPLQGAEPVASGGFALAIALRLQAVEINNRPLRMGGC